jgi:p-hydroxybenzoate 3-monooxygenase
VRTQVCIIGGGPSGLLLSQLLHRAGIDTVVLERRSRDYVLSRIRAGVLEWGSVGLLREAGVGDRMDREGFPHEGVYLAAQNRGFRIDFERLTGKRVMVWGQTEVTHDLYDARDAMGGVVIDAAEGVTPHGLDTDAPFVTYVKDGTEHRVDCDFVAGCDGFHGVSRQGDPGGGAEGIRAGLSLRLAGRAVAHAALRAGADLRQPRPRLRALLDAEREPEPLLHPGAGGRPAGEVDRRRLLGRTAPPHPAGRGGGLVTGPSIEKSIAPLRSFVAEPMRWGRLFLVGDAAHIVPPTGAKGLNLAIGDVHYLWQGLVQHYGGDSEGIARYSERALARVWKATRFSWWFTTTMHRFPDQTPFDQNIQESELAYLESSEAAQTVLAEQYVGMPY